MTRTLLFVGVALCTLAFWAGRRSSDAPARVAALTRLVDSLRATAPAFAQQQRVVDTVVRVLRVTSSTDAHRAATLHHGADSLGGLAQNALTVSRFATLAPQATQSAPDAFDSLRAIPLLRGQITALTGALDAMTGAYRADSVALDTLQAAHRDALARLARATAAADTGLALARTTTTWRLGFLRLPRVPKVVAALVGCSVGAYLDRAEPVRGCGLAGAGMVVLLPTR